MSEDFPRGAGGLLAGLAAGSRVGGYVLEEQAGAGGMAVVFRAVDERLGRRVALKVLAPAFAADEAFRQRFIRESRAAAAVDDPHIIPVHDAGAAGGVLFIAMRYVPGGDVRTLLHREGPLAPARAAAIISPVASALDAAHAAGLVHRDVKPANMLVDVRPDRPDHVYLSDFGLSKGTLSSAGLTGSGQYLGTPDYMAPEQIEGRAVDGRTDQYALACAAFELLAGVAPFQRDQGMAVLLAHLQQPPPSLGSRRPGLPAAVDEVFARALAKAPGDRYASCREFADALREALGVAAYHSGPGASPAADRPAAGHPATEIAGPAGPAVGEAAIPAGAAAASTIGPAPAGASTPAEAASIPAAPTAPAEPGRSGPAAGRPAAEHPATEIAEPAGQGSGETAIPAGAAAVSTIGPAQARASAPAEAASLPAAAGTPAGPDRSAPDPDVAQPTQRRRRIVQTTIAGVSIAAAVAVAAVLLIRSPGHKPASPASHRPASSRSQRPASSPTGLVATFTDPGGSGIEAVAFSPDGHTLATGDNDEDPSGLCNTYLWDVATGHRIATLADPEGYGVGAVAFSPRGRTLATGDGYSSTYLWDVATGHRIATLADPEGYGVGAVAFSPRGRTLATGDYNGSTYLWDVATGRRIATLTDPQSAGVDAVAFSPDGHTLATGDQDGSTYLWDMATGRRTATLADPESGGVDAVAFSRDGRRLATADLDGSTYLWDVATGRRIAALTDPKTSGVYAVAFSPDGRTLVVADGNGSTYRWDVATGRRIATLTDSKTIAGDTMAFSSDGRMLATGDGNGNTYLWRAR